MSKSFRSLVPSSGLMEFVMRRFCWTVTAKHLVSMHFVVTKWRTVSFSTFILWVLFTSLCFSGECTIALCIDIRWSFWYLHLLSILLSYVLGIYPDLFPMRNCLFEPSCVYLFLFSCFVLCVNVHCVPSSNTSIHQMLWWLKIIIRIWGIKSHVWHTVISGAGVYT